MEGKRGFEIVSTWKDAGISLPRRKTAMSAGYDIESAVETEVLPGEIKVIPTGLKAYMESDEYLAVYIRSSMAVKHGIMLANSTGIIDADYYGNEDNEGHIMCALYNSSRRAFHISKGDRIAQGLFMKYLLTDDDHTEGKRIGGMGSTGVQ